MTILVGTDPQTPIALSCNIHPSSGQLEVKYGTSSLTHPSTILHVDIDDLDGVMFQTAGFGNYSVEAATVDGAEWEANGTAVVSGELPGGEDPGLVHQVQVSASDGGAPKTATISLRIRERNISPLPVP